MNSNTLDFLLKNLLKINKLYKTPARDATLLSEGKNKAQKDKKAVKNPLLCQESL